MDVSGNIVWEHSFGGSEDEHCYSIQQASDGGFIAAGNTWSADGDVSSNHGTKDYWVLKLDSVGNITWEKTYGGSFYDYALSIRQTADGDTSQQVPLLPLMVMYRGTTAMTIAG